MTFCGATARGKNYGAISCESCKTIFRRNAHKYETLNCIYDNNCTIDVSRRKYCRKCRLRKCFAVGMRRERIWTENETSLRSSLIQKNRLKKQMAPKIQNVVNSYVKNANYNMTRIEYNDHDNSTDLDHPNTISLTIRRPLNANNLYSLPTITSDYQLDVINKFSKNTVSQTVGRQLLAIFLEQIVRKNVNVVKCIDAFACLTEHDQIILVKYGMIEMCMLLSALYLEIQIPYPFKFNKSLFGALKQCNIHDCKRGIFDTTVDNKWEYDRNVVNLMGAILELNPNRPHLIHRDVIEFQQHVYKHLLRKYLYFKYRSEYESSHKFQKLMHCLNNLNLMSDLFAKALLSADTNHRMPLMNEICICGDKARGNNYNVLSCDPCKCVFKRNAHKYESLLCIYDNNCAIDVLSRKFCRKCRLRKCFAIGMRKEMILSEDEKTLRLDLIQENRRNRQSTADTQLRTSQSTTPETNDINTVLTDNKQKHSENDYSIISLSIERPIANYLYIYFNDMETKRLSEWFNAINSYSLPTITSDYQLDVINKFSKNTVSQTVGRQLLAIYLELIARKMVKDQLGV
ncbi:unnamed protein product [Medioppia subpectinata]|uniref:Nuclear receptor n=1 Tax=Medioppia subpectinata TaxID=1979941 RepID=A0A7R9PU54_9ACAR|nr:unnamed protein product [Medioppia subpectinata]CAG2100421.1 unnamed protein product [Medioppia subpectinata]